MPVNRKRQMTCKFFQANMCGNDCLHLGRHDEKLNCENLGTCGQRGIHERIVTCLSTEDYQTYVMEGEEEDIEDVEEMDDEDEEEEYISHSGY
jgi:hypothetical protein